MNASAADAFNTFIIKCGAYNKYNTFLRKDNQKLVGIGNFFDGNGKLMKLS